MNIGNIAREHSPGNHEYITWTNVLQNRCYMHIQWTCIVFYTLL